MRKHSPMILTLAIVMSSSQISIASDFPATPGAVVKVQNFDDPPIEFGGSIRELRSKSDWDGLEELAKSLRDSKACWPMGKWKIDSFYKEIGLGDKSSTDAESLEVIEQLRRWVKEKPQSITARLALASEIFRYAWEARGNGFSNTVSRQGFRQFDEREAEALQIVLQAQQLEEKCPRLWSLQLDIGRDQGMSKESYNQIFNDCIKHYPGYFNAYNAKETSLLPRWHGEQGDSERFIIDSANAVGGLEGDKLYARLVWQFVRQECSDQRNPFSDVHFDWLKVKRGYLALMKEFPNSVHLQNVFCRLACFADDQKQAKELFAKLEGKCDKSVWKASSYIRYRTTIGQIRVTSADIDTSKIAGSRPGIVERQAALAYSMIVHDNTKEATQVLASLIKTNPDHPEVIFTRAVLQAYTDQPNEAFADFDQVIKTKPSFSAYLERGKLNYREKHFQNAIDDLGKAIELEDGNPTGWATRGLCYMALNEPKKAIADINQAVKVSPKDPVALDALAEYSYSKSSSNDSQKWALACSALLSKKNGERLDLLFGKAPTQANIKKEKVMLRQGWTIHSREQLFDRLDWLLKEGGHSAEFNQFVALSSQPDQIAKLRKLADPTAVAELNQKIDVARDSAKTASNSLLGWDLSRYIYLCRVGASVGYITQDEAWAKIMPCARKLQEKYSSWKELGENYVLGRKFWQPNNSDNNVFEQNLETLLSEPESPWVKLKWQTSLAAASPQWSTLPAPVTMPEASTIVRPANFISTIAAEFEVPDFWITGYDDPSRPAVQYKPTEREKLARDYASTLPAAVKTKALDHRPWEMSLEDSKQGRVTTTIKWLRGRMCACFLEGQALKASNPTEARMYFMASLVPFSLLQAEIYHELGRTSCEMAALWRNCGRAYDEVEDYSKAAEMYRRGMLVYGKAKSETCLERGICQLYYGNALLHDGKYVEAEKELLACLPVLAKQAGERNSLLSLAYKGLGNACTKLNKKPDAQKWYAKSK